MANKSKKKAQYHDVAQIERRGDWTCCNCGEVLKEAGSGPGGFTLHEVGECQERKKKKCGMCDGIDLHGMTCPYCGMDGKRECWACGRNLETYKGKIVPHGPGPRGGVCPGGNATFPRSKKKYNPFPERDSDDDGDYSQAT